MGQALSDRGGSMATRLGSRGAVLCVSARRIIYTTNAIESVNARVRKVIVKRGHFQNAEAATKPIRLALRNIMAEWSRATFAWKSAMNQFAILYGERFVVGLKKA
jgi:putative transposase